VGTSAGARPAALRATAGGRESLAGVVYAVAATAAFSTAAILVTVAFRSGLGSPWTVAFLRLAVGTAAIGASATLARVPLGVGGAVVGRLARYGAVAAAHFVLYIASFAYTSIPHAVSLVNTSPVFVAVGSRLLFGERLGWRRSAGIGVTVLGIGLLERVTVHLDPRVWVGDLLALGAAVCYALYSLAGRAERQRVPLLAYVFWVFLWAALFLAIPGLLTGFAPGAAGRPLQEATPGAWAAVVLLGLVPLALGHGLYNAAVRRASATVVNLIATQEVTGAVLLGAVIFGQVPSGTTVLGMAVALGGVALVLW
jgi:drug/metabolite transporter (DMT)-like permease